ncbi:uncharacterized protein LOC127289010 [Leptopilina boulardi]|uniref:uncharacterized protein LOC127289010 n=1 Tax=Leptopilina boulardi TaxID=63433 RepID=UPI0021F60666|nr:uncharacterized protein LOC127289010 [Leptopilina boulardi]
MWRILLFVILSGFSMAYRITEHESIISKKHINLTDPIFIKDAPYVATVLTKNCFKPQRISIAIIITSQYLITTERLYESEVSRLKVVTGTTHLENASHSDTFNVQKIKCDELESAHEHKSDMCIIKLTTEMNFNEFRKPITLLSKEYFDEFKYEYGTSELKVIGYGRKKMSHVEPFACMGNLKKKELKIPNKSLNLLGRYFKLKTGSYTCAGDIGTPVIWNKKLAGLVVDGPICENNICDIGIFSGIIHCYKWIEETIGTINLRNAKNFSYNSINDI